MQIQIKTNDVRVKVELSGVRLLKVNRQPNLDFRSVGWRVRDLYYYRAGGVQAEHHPSTTSPGSGVLALHFWRPAWGIAIVGGGCSDFETCNCWTFRDDGA